MEGNTLTESPEYPLPDRLELERRARQAESAAKRARADVDRHERYRWGKPKSMSFDPNNVRDWPTVPFTYHETVVVRQNAVNEVQTRRRLILGYGENIIPRPQYIVVEDFDCGSHYPHNIVRSVEVVDRDSRSLKIPFEDLARLVDVIREEWPEIAERRTWQ